jgi:hypothetical protein
MMAIYTHLLQQADIFYQFSADQLSQVATICQERTFQAGEDVFLEGSNSDILHYCYREIQIQVNPALVSDQPEEEYHPYHPPPQSGEIAWSTRACARDGARHATPRSHPPKSGYCHCDSDPSFATDDNLAADLALKIRQYRLMIEKNCYTVRK